jgi:hypothetical protein
MTLPGYTKSLRQGKDRIERDHKTTRLTGRAQKRNRAAGEDRRLNTSLIPKAKKIILSSQSLWHSPTRHSGFAKSFLLMQPAIEQQKIPISSRIRAKNNGIYGTQTAVLMNEMDFLYLYVTNPCCQSASHRSAIPGSSSPQKE